MPITSEQLRDYRDGPIMGTVARDTLEHISHTIPIPLINVDGFTVDLRDTVCSNPILDTPSAVACRCDASNLDEHFSQSPTFPRIRNNSAYSMDVDSIRNTLEGMTQNAVFGDLAVLRDRQFMSARYNADLLHTLSRDALSRKLEDDYRKRKVERIKKLISSKVTIRYIMEVK